MTLQLSSEMPDENVDRFLALLSPLAAFLAVFVKIEDKTERIECLFVACVLLVISMLKLGDRRWVMGIFMTFLALCTLYICHHLLKPSQTDDGAECELVNESNCWMHANNMALNLSGEINILDNNLIDEFYTNGLLSFNHRDRIAQIIFAEEKENSLGSRTLRDVHFNLLSCSFAKTGDKGYKSYCAILERIPEYNKFGLRLCRLCELCCVNLLNGTMLDNGSCSSYSPVVQTTAGKNEVNFIMDDICKAAFVEKRAGIKSALASLTVHETYVDTEHYDDTNPSVPVYEASLVCAGGRVLVSLIVGIEPDETTREMFRQVVSSALAVDPTMVDVSLKRKHSTWVLLRIPVQAGFELLSFRANRTLRKKVVESLTSLLPSIQADYVSVQIQVSTLQPLRLFFCPRRTEKKEATAWLHDTQNSLRPQLFATWSYDRTLSSVFKGWPVSSVPQILYSSDSRLSALLKWAARAFVFAVLYVFLRAGSIVSSNEKRLSVVKGLSSQDWKFDVYICSSTAERAFVEMLQNEMLTCGLRTVSSLNMGDSDQDAVAEILVNSPFFVVVFSRNFQNSPHLETEAEVALNFPKSHKKIIPVLYHVYADSCPQSGNCIELYKLAAITNLHKGCESTDEQFAKRVCQYVEKMAFEQLQSKRLTFWKPEGKVFKANRGLEQPEQLLQLKDDLKRLKFLNEGSEKTQKKASEVLTLKQKVSRVSWLRETVRKAVKCSFEIADRLTDEIESEREKVSHLESNLIIYQESLQRRRTAFEELKNYQVHSEWKVAGDSDAASFKRMMLKEEDLIKRITNLSCERTKLERSMESIKLKLTKVEKTSCNCWRIIENILALKEKHKTDDSLPDLDSEGCAALHSAVKAMRHADIKALVAKKWTNVNSSDHDGKTALMIAAENDDSTSVQILLEANADMALKDKLGRTALHASCKKGFTNVCQLLLEMKADIESLDDGGFTPFLMASAFGHINVLKLLIQWQCDTSARTKDRMSALHTAVCDGTLEVTEILIKANATLINSQTPKGWTPLHFAAKKNRCDILQLLLRYGGDVFKKSEDGRLPLHVACEVGSLECCHALVESAVDQSSAMVVSKPHNGWSPVFYAVNGKKGGHLNVLKWLVETFSVPIDEQDEENKQTPLHIACRLGFHTIAKYLIDCGAIVSSRNKDGYTPLHWAALYNKEDVVDVLIGNNADVNAQNNEKNTPLHLAKKKGNEAVCEKMISSGRADLSIKNKNGLTPEQVTSEVPPEILSRGEEAIYYYRLALKNGKTKPYRIKLMLLGDAEVGKTSLYRYLTCQEFIATLERTEGIDTRLISTPEIDPVSDTGWEVMNSPQSEFSDKIAQETVKLMKNAEASKAHGVSHMEEIPEQTKVSVMATSTSDEEQIPQRRIPADSVPPQTMDSSSVAQAAAVVAAVSVIEPKTWKQTETSDTASKQTFRPLSYDQPGTYYSRRSKDQSRYVEARKRHHIADDDVRNDTTVNASPILKPKKKKKKKSKQPDLPQHDFSEIPMKDIHKHWGSDAADHKSAKVKFYLWDFAGQDLYKSMHHTFLTRRAMYIIVLNLAKLTDKGISEFDLQRIYFWVASVHAHTPLKPEPVRIFFVGTHSKSPGVTQERVAKAIQQLQDWFENSDSFLCHIEYVEHDGGESLLTRVENSSSDFEDRNICVFRNALLRVALEQGYMQEEIPLMWLRYEDEILKFHNQSLSVSVVAPGQQTCRLLSVEDMHNIATKCQITVPEGSFKTMITFFHDTGLVIYPPAMHGLDLELQQRLENVVMPNPQWLVDLMKVLVNIPAVAKQSKSFRTDWRMLKKEGILTDQLVYHVMHDKQGFPCDQVNTLCLLFQALGFICKLLVRPNVVPSTRQVTEQFSKMSIIRDQPQEVSQIAATGGHQSDSCYLVPCQLPESRTDIEELCDAWTDSFLFNFREFLPPWLFQHLIVRLLNHMQTDRELKSRLKFKKLPLLSKKACLMAQNSKVEFIVELLSTRIVVRYQEKLRSYAPQLMKWLVGIVADIVKQKFTNLEFCCGQLCPHISCLKHQVEDSHLDYEQSSLPQLMDVSGMKELRKEGQSAIKCLQKLPESDRNALLSMAYNIGHVEESYTYVEGLCNQHEHSDCSFFDIYVSQKLEALSDSTGLHDVIEDTCHPDDQAFDPKDIRYDEEKDFIGSGGFAEVFQAVLSHREQDMVVALKKPYRDFTANEMAELRKEAAIWLKIPPHNHVVKIIGVCDHPQEYGLVLEFVGTDLDTALLSRSSKPAHVQYLDKWKNRLNMIQQITSGMRHLHSLSPPVIHCDLKPRNILVEESDPNYICKITDFGLSTTRTTSQSSKDSKYGSGIPTGTLVYIAPERYALGHYQSVTTKSDVYSFGVILWQFRERRKPFNDEVRDVIIVNIIVGVPFEMPNCDCPHGYEELTRQCCSKNPEDRPSFDEVYKQVQETP